MPFIFPGEREIANAILATFAGNVILLKPGGFLSLYIRLVVSYFDLCVQGSLLILSSSAIAIYGDSAQIADAAAIYLRVDGCKSGGSILARALGKA